MPLKRAFITQFLEGWAAQTGRRIVSCGLDDVLSLKQPPGAGLVILSVGAETLAEPRILAAHRVLAAAHPAQPLVVLGDRPDVENVERALRLGIAGYIPTRLEATVAMAALDFVLAGGSYFPPEALLQVSGAPIGGPPLGPRQLPLLSPEPAESRKRPEAVKTNGDNSVCRSDPERASAPIIVPPADLTSRQQQVLACLKRARSNKEIARELSMSEATVKVHVRQVMKKLGALNRTHAAVLAVDLSPSDDIPTSNIAPFVTKATVPLHHVLRR